MKTELKYTFDEEEQDNTLAFTNALERESFLFDLFSNFFRKWKHRETDPTLEEVEEALMDLKYQHNVILNN